MNKQLFIQTEQQQLWLQKLSTVEKMFKENAQQIDQQAMFPHDNITKLREIGYTKLTLPKALGGEGFTVYDAVLMHETLASYDANTALTIGWTLLTVGELFENQYWAAENLTYLAEQVADGAIINRALSEFAMGSPVRGGKPVTTATRQGDKWCINGRKNYTTGAPELDFFLTSVWLEEEESIAFFLIPKTATGLSIEETWDVMSMRATGSHDLVLENVLLEQSALVETPTAKAGFTINGWLLLIPATYLGIAQAARDYAVNFANTHSPNSIEGTIGQLPNVQVLIGEIELELAKARFTLYGAAQAYCDKKMKMHLTNEVNVAKHVVTNASLTIVDKAMRIVGAKSLQNSNPLQRYYRDVRAGLHNPPMDDVTIKKLAESALIR